MAGTGWGGTGSWRIRRRLTPHGTPPLMRDACTACPGVRSAPGSRWRSAALVLLLAGCKSSSDAAIPRRRCRLGRSPCSAGGNNVPARYSSDLWVHGGYAYTGTWNWIERTSAWRAGRRSTSFSWTPAGAPTLVDSLIIPNITTVSDVEVSRDGTLLVFSAEKESADGLYVYSLADPAHPAFKARYLVETGLAHRLLGHARRRALRLRRQESLHAGADDLRPLAAGRRYHSPHHDRAGGRQLRAPRHLHPGRHRLPLRLEHRRADLRRRRRRRWAGRRRDPSSSARRDGRRRSPQRLVVPHRARVEEVPVHRAGGPRLDRLVVLAATFTWSMSRISRRPTKSPPTGMAGRAPTISGWTRAAEILYAAYYNGGVVALDISGTLSGEPLPRGRSPGSSPAGPATPTCGASSSTTARSTRSTCSVASGSSSVPETSHNENA